MESNNDSADGDASGGSDSATGFADSPWDCDGCPPPFFELPPPPRPPFMDDGDFCEESSRLPATSVSSGLPSPYESCDNPSLIVVDSGLRLENDLLNVLLVVICAVLLVAVALVAAVVIWRWVQFARIVWLLEVGSCFLTVARKYLTILGD